MRLIRSAISVGGFTALSRLGGFVREWMQAHYIGASIVSDALNYAISFPSFFRRIFAEGAFNASFVPLFSSILAGDGVQEARRFAQTILSLLSGVLVLIILPVVIFSDSIMPFFLPGLKNDLECLALTSEFTRITFPFLLFISLTAFFSGMLNSVERFVAAASSPAVGNVAIILCLLLSKDFGGDPGHSLAIGVLMCGIVQFLWVFIPSQRHGVKLQWSLPTITPKVKVFLKRMVPAALGASVFQLNLIIDMSLASFLPKGAFSYLKYADRFSQLPLSIIGTAISTALLPMLARQWRMGETKKAMVSQNRALEFTLFFALPATACLVFMASDLIQGFYAHGKFKNSDILPTAQTLIALSSGLPAYVLVKVLSTSFFSRGDTRTPVILAIVAVIVNLILNITLIGTLQQVALGLSTAISSWLNAILLASFLRKKKLLIFDDKLKKFLPRILLATSIASLYLWMFNTKLFHFFLSLGIWDWASVCIAIAVFIILYVVICYACRVFTWKRIQEHLSDEQN